MSSRLVVRRICKHIIGSSPQFRRGIVMDRKSPGVAEYFRHIDKPGPGHLVNDPLMTAEPEKASVAAGLFVNRIELKSLIYPEFGETEELTETEALASEVTKLMQSLVDSAEIDKDRQIPGELLVKLQKMGIYGMRVPKQYGLDNTDFYAYEVAALRLRVKFIRYLKMSVEKITKSSQLEELSGGLQLNNKQVARIYEELSHDWSVLLSVYSHNELVVQAIQRFGTEEQKQELLPRLASGKSVGAFCLHEDASGHDTAAIGTSATSASDKRMIIDGVKTWVTNGASADILIVFAKHKSQAVDASFKSLLPTTAFIVDRKRSDGVTVLERHNTIGLKGAEIFDIQFDNVHIAENDVLGDHYGGFALATNVMETNRYVFAAAVSAFLRRLLGKSAVMSETHQHFAQSAYLGVIAKHCNETKRFGMLLSETSAVQGRIAAITRATYVAETLAYYIAGVHDDDEAGAKHMLLESSMATLFARRALSQSIVSSMELFGSSSATTELEYERLLRDSITLCAFLGSEDLLTSKIALTGLTTWAYLWRDVMHKVKRPLYYPWYVFKAKYMRRDERSFKLKHYLYEHVHPSLEGACRLTEIAMGRLEHLFRDALKIYGKKVEEEHMFLDKVANMGTSLFASIACISRASRSYSIGLKKSDLEMFLAHDACLRLARETNMTLDELFSRNVRGDEDLDLYAKKTSIQVTDNKGYPISSALSRNCDPAMKQFLLHLDETLELGFRFVIKDLDDDSHLFISPESVPIIQQRIDALMEKLSPDLAEKGP